MTRKVGHIIFLGYNFTFVFRHRYEKEDEDSLMDSFTMWREQELGFWYKNFRVVGKKEFNNPKKWNNNLVREHMLGINLLICKAWVTVSKGAMKINIDQNLQRMNKIKGFDINANKLMKKKND